MDWGGNKLCQNGKSLLQVFLFPRYKFLKDGWQDVLPNMDLDGITLAILTLRSLLAL